MNSSFYLRFLVLFFYLNVLKDLRQFRECLILSCHSLKDCSENQTKRRWREKDEIEEWSASGHTVAWRFLCWSYSSMNLTIGAFPMYSLNKTLVLNFFYCSTLVYLKMVVIRILWCCSVCQNEVSLSMCFIGLCLKWRDIVLTYVFHWCHPPAVFNPTLMLSEGVLRPGLIIQRLLPAFYEQDKCMYTWISVCSRFWDVGLHSIKRPFLWFIFLCEHYFWDSRSDTFLVAC